MIRLELNDKSTIIIEVEGDEWKLILRDKLGQQVYQGNQHIFTTISNFIQATIYTRSEDGD